MKMELKRIIAAFGALLLVSGAGAQEALWGGQALVSPEVHRDGRVTFRYYAPQAGRVEVTGDFLSPQADGETARPAQLMRDSMGVWSLTTVPLDAELYNYAFVVDGLRTTDPNNVYKTRDVATVSDIFLVGGGRDSLYGVRDVPHGTVTRRWYDSPSLGIERRMTIYTPPGYETTRRDYPVLYLLHGMGGDEEAWSELGRATQILDNLIARGEAEPMIVVMSNGNVVQQAAPGESADGLHKPNFNLPHTMDGTYEASFRDVIDFIDANYRTIRKAEGRAIAGLSMGGYHALHISRYYPRTFDYVGLFSAAIWTDKQRPEVSPVYADIRGTLAAQRDNGLKLYWIACGNDDFLWQANCDYRALLDSLEFSYTFRESDGGHIWRNWRIYLSEFVPQLFRKVNDNNM